MRQKINKIETISISEHKQGKMEGLLSLSTNKYTNKNCIALMENKNPDLICHSCFVDKTAKQYKDLTPSLQDNSDLLTARILNKEEIKNISKKIMNSIIFRFEAFGGLNNEIQLINYINIAKKCKYTKFGLWTKHFKVVMDYFKKGGKLPKNITLVLSAPFKNNELNNMFVEGFKKYHKRVITFTVMTTNSSIINCGKRKCIECRNCYDSKRPHNVYELIK